MLAGTSSVVVGCSVLGVLAIALGKNVSEEKKKKKKKKKILKSHLAHTQYKGRQDEARFLERQKKALPITDTYFRPSK
jgi:hypothetical protein